MLRFKIFYFLYYAFNDYGVASMEKPNLGDIISVWNRMKSGEEQALSEIFTFYYADLYQYGIKMVNVPDLVKDTIQDVFVRIWEKRSTTGNVNNPKAYLIASVRRKLLLNKKNFQMALSNSTTRYPEETNFSFSEAEFMEVEEISQQLRYSLNKAINTLPERQRELIFLRFYYNLRYLEAAQIMGVNEQTVRNLMQRALSKLRLQIDDRLWSEIGNMDSLLLLLFHFFSKKI